MEKFHFSIGFFILAIFNFSTSATHYSENRDTLNRHKSIADQVRHKTSCPGEQRYRQVKSVFYNIKIKSLNNEFSF